MRIAPIAFAALVLFGTGCSSNKSAEPAKQAEQQPATPPAAPPATATPETPIPRENAMVGQIQSVSPKGDKIVLRTAEGKQHTVEVTPETKVASLHDGMVEIGKGTESVAKVTAKEVKDGTMVAVHFTEKEGKLVASEVKRGSKAVVKETKVIVKKVDETGRKVIVQTEDGAEHVYEVGKEATIATGDKIVDIGKLSGAKIAEGTKATIHFSEQQGQKMLHFFKH
jgi:uncharacterized protein with PhoU and TrkA domain